MPMPAKTPAAKPSTVTVSFEISAKAAAFYATLGAKDARTGKPVGPGVPAQQLFKQFLVERGFLEFLEAQDG